MGLKILPAAKKIRNDKDNTKWSRDLFEQLEDILDSVKGQKRVPKIKI
jgi:hypothetical protein